MTIPAGQLTLFRRARGSGIRYGSLLLILVVTYLLSAFTVGGLVSAVQVILFLAVVLIALRGGRFPRRTGQILAVVLLLGSAAAALLELVDNAGAGGALASLWTALIMLLAVFYIVRQVLAQPEITEQSIYGVLSAYMMIGLIFAAVYLAMWRFSGQFFAHGADVTKTFQYFSFTTLTTLGYGDFTAATDAGRAVAVLEAMAGQMFLATLVARLVAGFRWSERAAARHGGHHPGPGADEYSPPDAGRPAPDPAVDQPGVRQPALDQPALDQPALDQPAPGQPAPGQPAPGQPAPGQPAPGQPGIRQAAADRPGPGQPARGPGPGPAPGPGGAGRSSSGRSQAKKASAPGLIRLTPPGAVRGRGTGVRRGGRNSAAQP
jgi:hypothetical protein